MELGVSHMQNLSSLPPIIDNIFDKYNNKNKNLVLIRSLLDHDKPIKPIQQKDSTEDTTAPAAPTEVEGPPSSHLQSKTKQQNTSPKQEQPEHNATPMDPPERNPAEVDVNSIDITPKTYSWSRLTELFSCSGKTIADPAPVSLP